MLKGLKNRLKKYVLSGDQSKHNIGGDIQFPGGISPISETQDDDVFIVGFPKSGNTLMQHIITHLVYGINEEGSRTMVNLIVPDIYANSHYFRFNDICYFKSHELPKPEYKKVIYILRDGREALLSFYHMRKNMGLDVSLKDLYSGKVKITNTTWQEHIQQWEANPFGAQILWLKFEDLKFNKEKELKKICKFLGIERSDDQLKEIIELTSLEHMKSLEKRKDWAQINLQKSFKIGNFIRQGKIDSYMSEVPIELINLFEKGNFILKKHYKVE